ncbi:MAG: VOC family protein [Clostridiales bacterium]|nr:VOC family protein [Clostridiales bacterium]
MAITGLSCIFPTADMKRTAAFYQDKLGFRVVFHLQCEQPHVCLYRDEVEIILIHAVKQEIVPNRELYGTGYDAYLYADQLQDLQDALTRAGVTLIQPLHHTDYQNHEFVIEDCDRRWLAFGHKKSGRP